MVCKEHVTFYQNGDGVKINKGGNSFNPNWVDATVIDNSPDTRLGLQISNCIFGLNPLIVKASGGEEERIQDNMTAIRKVVSSEGE